MTTRKVAISAVVQHRNDPDLWNKRFQGMLLDVLEELQERTGAQLAHSITTIPPWLSTERRCISVL